MKPGRKEATKGAKVKEKEGLGVSLDAEEE